MTTAGRQGTAVLGERHLHLSRRGGSGGAAIHSSYTITDQDGDTSTATLTVTVAADSVPSLVSTTNLTVDEDGFLATRNLDQVPPAANETDSTESLTDTTGIAKVTFGNDVPADLLGSIVLVDTAALDAQLTTLAGNPVVFALEAGTGDLVGKDGSTEVIRIHITGASLTNAATGEVTYTYSTTLSQPIKHASLDGQPGDNSENSALLSGVTFEVTDNDTSTTQGTFNVTIVDDVPVQTAGTEAKTVYEDLLAGGNPDTPANPVGAATVATGTLAALVSFGADQPGTFSLSQNTASLPALTSKGVALSYSVSGLTLTGFVDLGVAGGVFEAGVDRPVFTLTLSGTNNATYTFTLLDQIDHLGGNLSGAGDDQIKTIDFSSMLSATDADLDQVILDAGSLLITVEDDLPINNATLVTGAVDEDSLNNVSGAFGSLGNLDAVNVGTVAGGSLAGLVTVGADEPATFGFAGSFAGLTAQALTSKGVALSYSVSGLTLTGFVDLGVAGGVFEAGVDRPVFTLTLSGTNNATYTFTLLDQIDHQGGNLSGAGDDQIKTIDFSSMLVATDADLDQVALDAGSLLITVEDDLPINNATSVTGAVDEDSLNNVSGAFGSLGNLDAVNVGTVAGGSLAGLVTVGADEPATTFGFTGSFAGLTAQALTSKGVALSYSVSGLMLIGFVDLGVAGGAFEVGTDRPVFTLTLSLSGTNNATYTFTLLDQIDHQGGSLSGAGDDQIKTIDFSSMLVATDADLDQVALDAGSLLITVEDDLPINNATSVTGAVDEDSLNNVSGAFGSLGNLDAVNVGTVAGGSLAGLVTVGADEPATFGFAGSFAGLTAQALTSKGVALSYSVSGLTLTGFVDLGVAGGVFEAGVDRPVFTLTLSGTNNATYTFTLLDQIDHQGGNSVRRR